MKPALPFVGRRREAAQLQRLHDRGGHALIVGQAGIGKSALVAHLRETLGLCVCPASERLGEICDTLDRELGLEPVELPLVRRKNRLLKLLRGTKRAVVFDGVNWTPPKLGSFIENVSLCVPVWLCVRSEHPWDVGHIWPLLVRFERVELKPFHPKETQKLVTTAVREKVVPEKTLEIVGWLHYRAAGSPKILRDLLAEIARGHYDLGNPHALRRLDLDRHIHEMFPVTPFDDGSK